MNVGQVKALYFSNKQRGKIIAELYISVNYPIPANSVARINNSDNLIGGKYVEIVLGDSKKIVKRQGHPAILSSKHQSGRNSTSNSYHLKNKTERLLGSIDTVATQIQEVLNKETRDNIVASIWSYKGCT